MVANCYNDYLKIEKNLISCLENDEFMQLQEQYKTELFEKISPTKKSQTTKRKEMN